MRCASFRTATLPPAWAMQPKERWTAAHAPAHDRCDTGRERIEIMTRNALLGRITADPKVLGGKPVVRGLRISVEMILALLAAGESEAAVLDDYPELEPDDIRACLVYAHAAIAGERIEEIRLAAE